MADISYPVHRLLTNVERPFKSTHIRSIINATHRSDVSMSSLFLCIQLGLRDSHWMVLQLIKVVLKSLSLIHVLVREGSSERVLGYLAGNLDIFNINFRDSSGHPLGAILTPLIKKYAFYLQEKGALFRLTKRDWISQRQESSVMIKTMFEPKDILQESAYLMRLLEAVLACNWEQGDLGHVVTRQAFRIILADIMCLFQLLNECLVVILGMYYF